MNKRWMIFVVWCCAGVLSAQQYQVRISPDTILCSDQEAIIRVSPGRSGVELTAVARKGGGSIGDFRYANSDQGYVNQAIFSSPFSGEIEIEVMDNKNNKVGMVTVTVVPPTMEFMEDESIAESNAAEKRIPLKIKVLDQNGSFIKTAKVTCKVSEVEGTGKNKKIKPSDAKVGAFVLLDGYYEGQLTNLKNATYRLEFFDEAHLLPFDSEENPDAQHPSLLIDSWPISFN
ncbi:MAG TPA: hypothetical protein PLG25_09745 [bacterium]|nr:hypothetical protein [bacterium]HMW31970.1 hypothetical protein [bacterium]HMW36050.1 hypothetical protein [bacterium]HMY36043.1 hypothetical protein [bacterium]HMZ04776.1 hypothetical protein [bacterium]